MNKIKNIVMKIKITQLGVIIIWITIIKIMIYNIKLYMNKMLSKQKTIF